MRGAHWGAILLPSWVRGLALVELLLLPYKLKEYDPKQQIFIRCCRCVVIEQNLTPSSQTVTVSASGALVWQAVAIRLAYLSIMFESHGQFSTLSSGFQQNFRCRRWIGSGANLLIDKLGGNGLIRKQKMFRVALMWFKFAAWSEYYPAHLGVHLVTKDLRGSCLHVILLMVQRNTFLISWSLEGLVLHCPPITLTILLVI